MGCSDGFAGWRFGGAVGSSEVFVHLSVRVEGCFIERALSFREREGEWGRDGETNRESEEGGGRGGGSHSRLLRSNFSFNVVLG